MSFKLRHCCLRHIEGLPTSQQSNKVTSGRLIHALLTKFLINPILKAANWKLPTNLGVPLVPRVGLSITSPRYAVGFSFLSLTRILLSGIVISIERSDEISSRRITLQFSPRTSFEMTIRLRENCKLKLYTLN